MTPVVFVTLVAAGALGAVARAWIGAAVRRRWRRRGLATLAVNLAGAFAVGLWSASPLPEAWLAVMGTGFLGAFTTFSTWMVEVAAAGRAGRRVAAVAEAVGTLALGVALAALGFALGRGWG